MALLHQCYTSLSSIKLRSMFPGRKWSSVKQKAKKLGLKMADHRKWVFPNDSAFSGDDVLSGYWAGFIAADGCLKDSGEVTVALGIKDMPHLEKLAAFLCLPGSSVKPRGHGHKAYCQLGFRSPRIYSDLQDKYSLTPRKSLTLRPPTITDERQRMAYTLGYFDGNGCTYIKRESRKKDRLSITVATTRPVGEWLGEVWSRAVGFDVCRHCTQTQKTVSINASCGPARAVLEAMYSLVELTDTWLVRKWRVYNNFVST